MDKVSAIIPTYNRFVYLMNAIQSIKNQTYENIEIIVVNDCSTQKEYYEYDWSGNNITILHLDKNTKEIFGFPCAAFVRNKGIHISNGKYISFCDDDDIWLPKKIELQIFSMKENNCKMSSTDGFIGDGVYDSNKTYKMHNKECCYEYVNNIHKLRGNFYLEQGFPKIWNLEFLKHHNFIICSSVIMEKEILEKIEYFRYIKPPGEDYDCWLKALEHTSSIYISEPCFYYDGGHGDGQHY
jgi:glycosyltransferase involved in cell wall biosynthesis